MVVRSPVVQVSQLNQQLTGLPIASITTLLIPKKLLITTAPATPSRPRSAIHYISLLPPLFFLLLTITVFYRIPSFSFPTASSTPPPAY